ncbi:MAG: TrmH family RNA methyltransferase [Acidobacteriota bacterium]
MSVLKSRRHPIVALFRKAARDGGPFALIDGWHLLREAHEASLRIDTVAIADEGRGAATAPLLAEVARHAKVVTVSAGVMDALSPVRTPTGVVALVARREAEDQDLLRGRPALLLVAVDIQDPGNVGALIRAGEAGGATGVAIVGQSADPWGWKALRAAMGSTFRLPVLVERDTATLLGRLQEAGLTTFATVPRGGTSMELVNLRDSCALVFGSEGAGLSASLLDLQPIDGRVSIPLHGRVESLNVAVAVGVLVYEARRQRHTPSGRSGGPSRPRGVRPRPGGGT